MIYVWLVGVRATIDALRPHVDNLMLPTQQISRAMAESCVVDDASGFETPRSTVTDQEMCDRFVSHGKAIREVVMKLEECLETEIPNAGGYPKPLLVIN